MPLTPADVHNVAFKKPPIGKRGYDEEEVDAFLDEVERELARLIEENNDLKAQAERVRNSGPVAQAPAPNMGAVNDAETRRLASENSDLKAQMERMRQEVAAAKQQAASAQSAPSARGPVASTTSSGESSEAQVSRLLMLAQRTADEHVEEARREADKLLTDARSKAEAVTREARSKADALERDARQRHEEAMGGLDAKRSALQKHIEELKAFEREYRTRLKAYLESQLRDLEGRAQSLEAETGGMPGSTGSGSGSVGGGGGSMGTPSMINSGVYGSN